MVIIEKQCILKNIGKNYKVIKHPYLVIIKPLTIPQKVGGGGGSLLFPEAPVLEYVGKDGNKMGKVSLRGFTIFKGDPNFTI